ncbi:LysR family transcriptional regulator [Microbacterium dextranolyticum]|uniref:Transcriptional regulator n=1 Tax=Microbacterium dextranolyticum TaxID=36806 RepID=A0A9W6M5U8_9MICO|nr:LysR substrate-binding domain-containing protein [Microbacterium dextranolyticum]MBM7464167.1 DNA-binding transcriptional LysR family regulator [Microbacterium dextranolyticum]GLJ95162.1 transcriptional regulator [Microbacterium dextranolyticum]
MEIRWLEAFVVVAEELHFGRAAQRLHVAQSPLSQTIRRLEASIGADLFERNTRSVSLTPAGRALLPKAYRVIQDLALATDAARTASGAVHGTVRIGFSGAFNHLTLPVLARSIRRELPEIDLQLVSRVRTGDGVAKLRNGTLDLAFVGLPLVADDIDSRLIARTRLGAVVPIDHPLADAPSLVARQLADDDFLSMPVDGSSAMTEALLRCCIAAGFRPRITQEVTDPYIMLTLVAAGLGVTIAAEDLASIMPRGARWIPLDDAPLFMLHGIGWMADEQSSALRAVLRLSEAILPTPPD